MRRLHPCASKGLLPRHRSIPQLPALRNLCSPLSILPFIRPFLPFCHSAYQGGAALTFLAPPHSARRTSGLAGFLPEGAAGRTCELPPWDRCRTATGGPPHAPLHRTCRHTHSHLAGEAHPTAFPSPFHPAGAPAPPPLPHPPPHPPHGVWL